MSGKFCGFATLFAVGVPSWSMAGRFRPRKVESCFIALPAFA